MNLADAAAELDHLLSGFARARRPHGPRAGEGVPFRKNTAGQWIDRYGQWADLPDLPTFPTVASMLESDEPLAVARAALDGEYAGFSARVRHADRDGQSVLLDITVLDRGGAPVGTMWRRLSRDGVGNLYAVHDIFTLDPQVQGQGFATEFNAHMEDWYRRSGVQRIQLHAGDAVGGYAWARQGYTWADGQVPGSVRERVESWLNNADFREWAQRYPLEREDGTWVLMTTGAGADELSGSWQSREEAERHWLDGTYPMSVVMLKAESGFDAPVTRAVAFDEHGQQLGEFATAKAALDALRAYMTEHGLERVPAAAAAGALLERIKRGELVTPFEISQFGWREGQGRDDMWPGKEIMLGSDWDGVKWLR